MGMFWLVITLFFAYSPCWGIETYSGFIAQNGYQRILKTKTQSLILTTENSDVKSQLMKLKTNDFISGLGRPLTGNLVRLETIDFVGLNNFLGLWMSPMGLFKVQNFSSLSVSQAPLNYSITPGSGTSWVLFLTDENQIYFSNLTVAESKATIRFFDTKTGAFQREVFLSKISQ